MYAHTWHSGRYAASDHLLAALKAAHGGTQSRFSQSGPPSGLRGAQRRSVPVPSVALPRASRRAIWSITPAYVKCDARSRAALARSAPSRLASRASAQISALRRAKSPSRT